MLRYLFHLTAACCLLAASCAQTRPPDVELRQERNTPGATTGIATGYHPYVAMTKALQTLAADARSVATLESLATTVAGREIWLLRIAAEADPAPDQRQALLIVGGIDAEHPASSETALNVARQLLRALVEKPGGQVARMLRERTVYVVPRANPDGIETFFETPKRGDRVNAHPVDDDRDGQLNEDGPNDLNHDGLISVMRIRDPHGQWMSDPDEPRLLKKADRSKGERGIYKLMREGVDDDADGLIDEDGPGGVDDDRNWPHFYEPGDAQAGAHQLSEPQTRALAEFVVAHPQIAAAIVYGRHDNVVNVPQDQQRGPTGQAYRDLHPDDVELYEHVGQEYKRITALAGSPGCNPEGALYAWLYSHRGIPTFATNLWWPIQREESRAATQPTSQPDTASERVELEEIQIGTSDFHGPPEALEKLKKQARQMLPERMGTERPTKSRIMVKWKGAGRKHNGEPGGDGDHGDEQADPVAARVASSDILKRWLKYSDEQRDGEGFSDWTPLDHPTLGQVEIGGLAPYFTSTPPADQLDNIAERQVDFLLQVADWLPAPRFGAPKVTDVGGGVWQVELRLVNDGYLPTHIGIARHVQLPPIIVRPMIDRQRLLGGKPLERVDNLPGSGGAASLQWLIRGEPGDTVEFQAKHPTYGELRATVVLQETSPANEALPDEEDE